MVEPKVIDLRTQPKGCSEHPLIRLKKAVASLKEGEVLKVVTDEEVVPLKTIEVMASKAGLVTEVVKVSEGVTEVVLRRGKVAGCR